MTFCQFFHWLHYPRHRLWRHSKSQMTWHHRYYGGSHLVMALLSRFTCFGWLAVSLSSSSSCKVQRRCLKLTKGRLALPGPEQIEMILVKPENSCTTACSVMTHLWQSWASKAFFPGGRAVGDFPKIFFQGGPKVVKFVLYPSKLKKIFFANNFKIQGGQGPLCPPFHPHDGSLSDDSNFWHSGT